MLSSFELKEKCKSGFLFELRKNGRCTDIQEVTTIPLFLGVAAE